MKPNISTDSLKLPGYKPPYRRDRIDRLGGGVVVFVKDEINCVTRLDLQVGSVECIWLEIKINNTYMERFIFLRTVQGRIQGGGGAHPAPPPPPKIGKNMIFWRKIVIFHTKYPKTFPASLRHWKKFDFLA